MGDYLTVLRILMLITCLVLLARLLGGGLVRVYPWFFAYILAESLRIAASFFVSFLSKAYGTQWKIATTIKSCLAIFVVLELYRYAMAGTPALRRYSLRVAGYIMLAAGLASIAVLLLTGSGRADLELPIHRYQSAFGTLDSWLFILVALIAWFILWFPVSLSRNAVWYILVFVIFFLSETVAHLISVQLPLFYTRAVGNANLMVSWLCLVCWAATLGGRGEFRTSVIGHWWNKEQVERLSAQLQGINGRLERLGTKERK